MRSLLSLLVLCIGLQAAQSQTATWADDVAPILFNHCTSCHHNGGIAPFSLMTYGEAASVASVIQSSVNSGYMPPWPPDPSYRHFKDERLLSATEITTINDWVNGGWPSGNVANAPAPPVYNNIGSIANPDMVSTVPNFTVNLIGDVYQCFVIPSGLLTDKFITEFEVIPGNPEIVHHVLIFQDTSSLPLQLDAATPEPGYLNFGGTGSSTSEQIGAWVPGSTAYKFPAGFGTKVMAGANIILQVHYAPGSLGQTDNTSARFRLSPNNNLRNVIQLPLLNHFNYAGLAGGLENGPLFIPANTTPTFIARLDVPLFYNVSLLTIAPHMHLIGKTMEVFAVTPAQDTIPYININNWDFRWQGSYSFQTLMKLSAGSKVYAIANYDNTVNNFNNPNFPPQNVFLGEGTADEMMLVYFGFALYEPGDENYIVDSTLLNQPVGLNEQPDNSIVETAQLYEPIPNPAPASSTFSFFLPYNEPVYLSLFDLRGNLVRNVFNGERLGTGFQTVDADLTDLPSGQYLLSLQTADVQRTKKLVIVK